MTDRVKSEAAGPAAQVPAREDDIAVVGMAGRFPGARDLDELWSNLEGGVESIREVTEDELLAVGTPREKLDDPNYIRAGAFLGDVDLFDAGLFDLSPREAEIIDPQQRLLLEKAWQALEDAGYDSRQVRDRIGVFAAVGTNSYLFNIYSRPDVAVSAGRFNVVIANENDYVASRISFKLDLRGPSVNVQSACSSSLLAVHLACESVRNGESDMALAGGVYAATAPVFGYNYRAGDIKSADGHCRPFDAGATGTIFSGGVGVVVLKRLVDAIEDGDSIRAVIRGSAVTNDGAVKVGYTAPGVPGQRAVIAEALAVSEVDPETVSYVEAHGTGTSLGDPIEVTALTQAYRAHTDKRSFCALGSIKGNIGHADVAAGMAGLSKVVLALQHRQIPPSLNFERPNPQIDFASSPFFVNDRLREWEANGTPRRAGVSAFGIGGTNVHALLQEAPAVEPSGPSRSRHLLTVSARTAGALEQACANLLARLESDPSLDLADTAFTLTVGRRSFEHRRALVCRDREDALALLRGGDAKRVHTGRVEAGEARVAFLFSGQGSQYASMAAELYRSEPGFRAPLDRCAEILEPHLGLDLRPLLFPEPGDEEAAGERLAETALTQPALFAVEYALAQLWMDWGVEPEAMIGHSVGEYVAACLAGVLDLESALALVAARGRLMQALPAGSMLGVSLPGAELQELLDGDLALAATNGPKRSVVSGPPDAVAALAETLEARGVTCRRLHTSHAFHSAMMDPMLAPFRQELARVELRPPRVPFVSNVTGTWIRDEEATDPGYWLRHARGTVRFSEGLATLAEEPDRVFLEVGPGTTLATLTRQHPGRKAAQAVVASTRHPKEARSDVEALLDAAGELWVAGVRLDGAGMHRHQRRRRVPLPTYPFERKRYWVDRGEGDLTATLMAGATRRELADWFYLPYWQPSVPPALPADLSEAPRRWLLVADEEGLSGRVAGRATERLKELGQEVVTVCAGSGYERLGDGAYTVAPGRREDAQSLLEDLAAADCLPDVVLHLWSLEPIPGSAEADAVGAGDLAEAVQERGFYSLVALAQGLGRVAPGREARILVASAGMQRVGGEGALIPEKATVLGPCLGIPREYPHLTCTSVDVDVPAPGGPEEAELVDHLLAEACRGAEAAATGTVAYRGGERRVAGYAPVHLDEPAPESLPWRAGGVYLITGGLGGIGRVVAEHLAQEGAAGLVLVGRSGLPPRDEWEAWLAAHPEGDRTAIRVRAVQALEAAGAEVLVAEADVADPRAIRSVVGEARERFGAVHGVVHAAGVAGGGMLQLRERSAAEAVLRPKLAGTRALAAALGEEPLDFFVLCSSTFAVLGGVGQVDYAAANSYLDAFAQERRARGLPTTAIDWAAWREVGMAVETVVGAEPPRSVQTSDQAPSPGPSPAPDQTPEPTPVEAPEPAAGPLLLGDCLERSPERVVYRSRLAPESHWVLAEHRVAGSPTVPGTTYLELLRAAFEDAVGPGPVAIRDLVFAQPLAVPEGASAECRLTLSRAEGGGAGGREYDVVVEGRRAGEEAWQTHVSARVGPGVRNAADPHDLARLREACGSEVEVDLSLLTRRGGLVEWGPRWASLRSLRVGDGEVLAELELPAEFRADLDGMVLHPALLDVATAVGAFAIAKEAFLPLSYGRVEVLRDLPERFFSHARRRPGGDSGEVLSFDVTLMGPEGAECVRIEGFNLKRVGAAAERLARPGAGEGAAKGLYARDGMSNAEGIEALRRLLAVPRLARVVVSPMDLPALLRRAAAARSAEPASRPRHARPDTGAEFVEPSTEVERTLAGVWSEVLGLDRVGLDDDFFRLGGDSVLGIQIIAQSGEAGIRLRPEQLFEHSTLRELARAVGEEASEGAGGAPLTPFQRRVLGGEAAPWIAAAVGFASADAEAVERALAKAMERHEALRLRFPEGAATEVAVAAEPRERPPALRRLAEEEDGKSGSLERAAETLGRTLDPVRGPVLAAGWAQPGTGGGDGTGGGVLLLVAHRAVVDGPSLRALCEELADGAAPAAPGAPAVSRGAVAELAGEETTALHGEVAESLRAEPQEILLAALLRAARRGRPTFGDGALAVDLEWNGRGTDAPASGSAVGCFVASSTVLVPASADGTESSAETVRRVKEAARRTPEETSDRDRSEAEPEPAPARLRVAIRARLLGDVGAARVWVGGEAPRDAPALLEVQAAVSQERLRLELWGAGDGLEPSAVEELAGDLVEELEAILAQARTDGAETWSPADFPDADLSQEALDSVLSKLQGD